MRQKQATKHGFISIDRRTGQGRYADIIDAAAALQSEYGSLANAVAAMVRSGSLYRSVIAAARTQKTVAARMPQETTDEN